MQLDVIADPICPWCYVGQRHLEEALRRRPIPALTIRWRPFMLDPSIPPEGVARKAYYEQRFGSEERALASVKQAVTLGQKAGIRFAFNKMSRIPNTLDAHRLMLWASAEQAAQDAQALLFRSHFEEGADIGDRRVLTAIADRIGLDAERIAALFETDTDIETILAEDRAVRELGINGVPCILVDEKYALMGAQDPANLVAVFERIEAHRVG
jgi:predicted DsbA family dithiol-disulfide isomerase